MARHTRCLNLESKPGWLYINWIFYPRTTVILSVSEGNFCVYISTCTLSATLLLSSWEKLCIYVYVAACNSPLKCSAHWGEHIYICIFKGFSKGSKLHPEKRALGEHICCGDTFLLFIKLEKLIQISVLITVHVGPIPRWLVYNTSKI